VLNITLCENSMTSSDPDPGYSTYLCNGDRTPFACLDHMEQVTDTHCSDGYKPGSPADVLNACTHDWLCHPNGFTDTASGWPREIGYTECYKEQDAYACNQACVPK
jgi:hypothetical protein